ncbi:hypothetical protein D5085_01760 [Ectothiorhodospiraceae bacterium BW-2]|nr:hypothetical protein D5085_01760 [Ectothiorhodospiraceae bacterium BW-2]
MRLPAPPEQRQPTPRREGFGVCYMMGMIWISWGVMSIVQPQSFSLLTLELEHALLTQLLHWLYAAMAIWQGIWFFRQQGLVPWLGGLFFLILVGYLTFSASRHYDSGSAQADWHTLILMVMTTLSLLGCSRKAKSSQMTE